MTEKIYPKPIVELIGNTDFKGKTAYFGFEPSGKLHKGHLNPIKALQFVKDGGSLTTVLVADFHARLNDKLIHNHKKLLEHLPNHTTVVIQSELYRRNSHDILMLLSQMSSTATYRRTLRSICCAGRENEDVIKMSYLFYVLLQCIDIILLDVDIVIGGTDQRKIHMFAKDIFKKMGLKKDITFIHTELLLDKKGNKISSSQLNKGDEL